MLLCRSRGPARGVDVYIRDARVYTAPNIEELNKLDQRKYRYDRID